MNKSTRLWSKVVARTLWSINKAFRQNMCIQLFKSLLWGWREKYMISLLSCCVLTFEPWLQMFSWALFSRDRTHIFNKKEVSTWTGKTHQRRRYTYCLILLSGSGNAAASCKRSSRACNTFCKCQCRRDIDPDPWVTSNQQSATHRFPMDSHQKQQAFFFKENSKLYWSILMFRHNSTVII